MILGLAAQIAYAPMLSASANPDSPVANAIIMATSEGGYGFNTTMPNGHYIITQGLTAGTYNVSAIAEGYINQEVGGISVTVGAETANVNFNLKRSGGISGKVTDSASGSGIANVVVTAFSNGKYGWFGLTDSSGNYKIITNLETGTYNVTVFIATGYFSKTISGVSITAGVETTGVNISLGRSAIISGKVKTPAGDAVPGITVTAMSSDGGGYTGYATTGVDGSYKIESGIGAGTYMVTAFSGTSYDQVQNVQATVGKETPNVNLTLNVTVQPSGAISGLVTDTDNNPIVGATISAGSSQDTSDSKGAYTISSGLPTGTYTVSASALGYQQQSQAGVKVTTGSTTSGINFKLTKIPAAQSGRISGTVTGESNPLSNKQPSSITCTPSKSSINVGDTLPISGGITPTAAGASVKIEYKSGSTDVTRSATTGSDGKYSDNYAPTTAGAWTAQASWDGDSQHTGASSEAAAFTVTQPTATTGGIKATILDSSGKPIVGATVSSTATPSGQASLSGTSGSDGSVSFTAVAAGSYTLQASMSGYVTNAGTVNVVAGSITTSSITLQTTGGGGTPSPSPTGGGGTPSGGIPGYPAEVIAAGVITGLVVLLMLRRRQ